MLLGWALATIWGFSNRGTLFGGVPFTRFFVFGVYYKGYPYLALFVLLVESSGVGGLGLTVPVRSLRASRA